MRNELLVRLEKAVQSRNPDIIERLKPGMAEGDIQRMLSKNKIFGKIDPIVALFSWRNGTHGKPGLKMEEISLFPHSVYMLSELSMMIAYFKSFNSLVETYPRYSKIVDRYFPIFWNGTTDFIAVEIFPEDKSTVVILEHKAKRLVRMCYCSFEEFIEDAIRANENGKMLKCFESNDKESILEGDSVPVREVWKRENTDRTQLGILDTKIANQFGDALANNDYKSAHSFLTKDAQICMSPDDLHHAFDRMIAYAPGPVQQIKVMDDFTLTDWPERREEDIAIVYVSVSGLRYVEAVVVTLADEGGVARIRHVEWGRR